MDSETAPGAITGRDQGGRFRRTEASQLRDTNAVRLRAAGKTYQQIADELAYGNKGEAWRAVHRVIAEAVKDSAEQLIAVESARLDNLFVAALEVLERDHYAHNNGKLVVAPDGAPVLDDAPKLAAIRELRQISESYRRLHGLDQPAKVSVDGGVRYEVVGIDPADLT